MFLPTFLMFLEFDEKMRMNKECLWNNMVNSNKSNSPPFVSEKKFVETVLF